MNKTDLTTAFEQTSFLYGGNATFIEEMYARFLDNPSTVDSQWRQFFTSLGETPEKNGGPSWQRAGWPPPASGDLISALDGNWPTAPLPATKPAAKGDAEDVRKATTDSVRALMMIRAYRMRGHLAADLDPLRLKDPVQHPELDPASYGFREADLDRPIFLDNVLGLEHANMRQIIEIL